MNHDRAATEALLRTGVLVPVRVAEETVTPGPDEGEFGLRLDISFDADEDSVGNCMECIRYRNGELQFDADYLRGRRMKTRVQIRPEGTGFIETVGRGKAATHWIARLQGSQPLRAVDQ